MSDPRVEIEVLERLCRSCDACVAVCPPLALRMESDVLRWDRDRCAGCTRCVVVCPARALVVHHVPGVVE